MFLKFTFLKTIIKALLSFFRNLFRTKMKIKEEVEKAREIDLTAVNDLFRSYIGVFIVDFKSNSTSSKELAEALRYKMIVSSSIVDSSIFLTLFEEKTKSYSSFRINPSPGSKFVDNEDPEKTSYTYRISLYGEDSIDYITASEEPGINFWSI